MVSWPIRRSPELVPVGLELLLRLRARLLVPPVDGGPLEAVHLISKQILTIECRTAARLGLKTY